MLQSGSSLTGSRTVGGDPVEDVVADEIVPGAPHFDVGREVVGGVTALSARRDRVDVGQIAADRLGTARLDGSGRAVRPGQRPHPDTVGDEPLDQAAADEP